MVAEITVEIPRQRTAAQPADPPRDTIYQRPDAPDRIGLARLARRLIGVREDILAWVPEERPRYTRLGLIVVNTGLMAAVSLATALTRVVSVPWLLLIPAALFWGALIITIDSWMVSSSHGALGPGRWFMFVPRLLMAVLLGAVIAEPLVLWIFHPAIHTNVEQHRQALAGTERGLWTRCNPSDGADTTAVAECRKHQLGIESPSAMQVRLTSLRDQRAVLKKEYDSLIRQRDQKQALAQAECAGRKVGNQTSGDAGWGKRCEKAWQVAGEFEKQADLPGKGRQIGALDTDVKQLTTELAGARQNYNATRETAINTRVAEYGRSFTSIDLIDEANGLTRLSDQSRFVWSAEWLVRILLILIDSLPVLAKMLSGTTSYDRLVNRQLRTGEGFHEMRLDYAEHAEKADTAAAVDAVDSRSRQDREQHDEDLEAEIDRRAQRYASEMA
jgi:hypothetical protein